MNICFNLLLVNLIFLFGVTRIRNFVGCYVLAAMLHYFLLVTWCWMSANAYNMYRALTIVSLPLKQEYGDP